MGERLKGKIAVVMQWEAALARPNTTRLDPQRRFKT
jgi:hypothetical protein